MQKGADAFSRLYSSTAAARTVTNIMCDREITLLTIPWNLFYPPLLV